MKEVGRPTPALTDVDASRSRGRPGQTAGPRLGPAQQLEDLWRHGEKPDVQDFIRRQGIEAPAQIVAALCVDQWHRWQSGERIPAEHYLQAHPALTVAWADSFELVSAEFHIRQELGESPTVAEYLERFPQFAAKLHKLEAKLGPSGPPATTNLNTPAGRISTAGDVVVDRKVTSQWPEVPGYRVLAKLGQGGMGHVYKAMQERLNRLVALKIIRRESLSQDPRAGRRFQREAQAAAQLCHPNIIVIYDFNQSGQTYYIAMEYVEGVDLHQLVQDYGPLPLDLAADLILQTAHGLQHAHQSGMVHRDIKPSNLMAAFAKKAEIREQRTDVKHQNLESRPAASEAPTSSEAPTADLRTLLQKSVVKILDMGTALLVHGVDSDSAKCTQQGTLMGTPDYLAPEQAMDSHAVDIRADLYSLGCTFYYLLTGKPPFGQYPLMKKLMMHQSMLPRPVRELRPEVSPHIEMVVHRLLAKRPEERFQTPADLIEALTTHQLHSSALVGPSVEPRRPVVRKTPEGGTPLTEIHAKTNGRTASGHSATVSPRPLAESQASRTDSSPSHGESLQTIAVLKGDPHWVVGLAFSPDRNKLASGSLQGNLRLWSFSKGQASNQAIFQAPGQELHALAYFPDSQTLASASGGLDGTIWLWDLTQPIPQIKGSLVGHRAPVEVLTHSSDGALLASGGADKTLRVWDLSQAHPTERAIFKGHTDTIKCVAFAPDGKTLASGSFDGTVRLWRKGGIWSREMVAMIRRTDLKSVPARAPWGPVHTVAFSPDGHTIAFGGLDQTVQVWDMTGDRPMERAVLQGHNGVVRLVVFSADGKTLTSVCDSGRVILWNLQSTAILRDWQLPRMTLCSVAFTHDARYLAAGANDGTVHVYRLFPK
jgi:serine/threonine protein kinase